MFHVEHLQIKKPAYSKPVFKIITMKKINLINQLLHNYFNSYQKYEMFLLMSNKKKPNILSGFFFNIMVFYFRSSYNMEPNTGSP